MMIAETRLMTTPIARVIAKPFTWIGAAKISTRLVIRVDVFESRIAGQARRTAASTAAPTGSARGAAGGPATPPLLKACKNRALGAPRHPPAKDDPRQSGQGQRDRHHLEDREHHACIAEQGEAGQQAWQPVERDHEDD